MNQRLPGVISCLLCLFFSLPLTAHEAPSSGDSEQASPEYVIGYIPLSPFVVPQPDAEPTGLFAELMREGLTRSGIHWRLQEYPVARYYKSLVQGDIHIQFVLPGIPALEASLNRSPAPLFDLDIDLFWMPGTPDVESVQEISGKRLLVILGFYYGGMLDQIRKEYPGVEIYTAPDYEAALRMLAAGRGDYLLSYRLINAAAAKAMDLKTLSSAPVSKASYHLAVHKTVSHSEELLQRLQGIFDELQTEGFVAAVMSKYASQVVKTAGTVE